MIELPEAAVLARQINQTLTGRRIERATAGRSPHKFAWYTGDPAAYNDRLAGQTIGRAEAWGGDVAIRAGDQTLLLSVPLRYHPAGEPRPQKHQLLLEFDDGSALSATVQMWGGLFCAGPGEPFGDEAYHRHPGPPSPLNAMFDRLFFDALLDDKASRLSAKAFLATEQRIPGLGNGVLQDILWTAKIHPRRSMDGLTAGDLDRMYGAVKSVLQAMADQGGRDTEKDLFGRPGGYRTILSKNTVDLPCPACGTPIAKASYLGGAIYFCRSCQKEQGH